MLSRALQRLGSQGEIPLFFLELLLVDLAPRVAFLEDLKRGVAGTCAVARSSFRYDQPPDQQNNANDNGNPEGDHDNASEPPNSRTLLPSYRGPCPNHSRAPGPRTWTACFIQQIQPLPLSDPIKVLFFP